MARWLVPNIDFLNYGLASTLRLKTDFGPSSLGTRNLRLAPTT